MAVADIHATRHVPANVKELVKTDVTEIVLENAPVLVKTDFTRAILIMIQMK